MNKEIRHVGRPTNEEVKLRKRKRNIKIFLVVLIILFVAIGFIALTNNTTTFYKTKASAFILSDFDFSNSSNPSFDCKGLKGLLDKVWKIILIAGPALMLIMSTIEFTKPVVGSDADALKKATSNTIKRAIALLLLMALKVIINVVLNFFGLQSCV